MEKYMLTDDQALALRMYLGEHWSEFVAGVSQILSEDGADELYRAIGGDE